MPVCTRNVLRWSSRAPSPRPAPITPDVLDPCGDAWRRPSPSVALSAELSNDSGFSSSIVRTGTVALSDHGCRLGEPVRLVHQ